MIPPDLAARLRMLTEASFFETDPPVAELARIRAVSSNLPDFSPGQRIQATIQAPLSDGTFRALVDGRQLTLALATPLPAGATAELEIAQVTPTLIHARQISSQEQPELRPSLSPTGKFISMLLRGDPASEPVQLAGGKPLLAAPPTTGRTQDLVPALKEALTRSGLFYESHQARWLAGGLSIRELSREPQGQLSSPAPRPALLASHLGLPPSAPEAPLPALYGPGSSAAIPLPAPQDMDGAPMDTPGASANPWPRGGPETAHPLPQAGHGRAANQGQDSQPPSSAATPPTPRTGPAPEALLHSIPDPVLPVVSQQLNALATHLFVWQGQVWPGQSMEWEIQDSSDNTPQGQESTEDWKTTLRLTLPSLGQVEARLRLTPSGVSVHFTTQEPTARQALGAGSQELGLRLQAAGVPLLNFDVEPNPHG